MNLLSNAIKFTPPGGRVEIELQCIDADVQIRVCDNGSGIGADFLPYVFERFRQADAASEGQNRGATFTVKLPVSAGMV